MEVNNGNWVQKSSRMVDARHKRRSSDLFVEWNKFAKNSTVARDSQFLSLSGFFEKIPVSIPSFKNQ